MTTLQVRWNFKLVPNQSQIATIERWLVTLRKQRNYDLRQRKDGYETNNKNIEVTLGTGSSYAYGSYCDLDTGVEYGACYPLTCPVQAHGVIPEDLRMMFKTTRASEGKPSVVKWDSLSGIQSKVTTILRSERANFAEIDSQSLQVMLKS